MTVRSTRLTRVLVVALCAGVLGGVLPANADNDDDRNRRGYGMMGQGYGQGYGPGMMGQGYGPGMMGQGYGPGMMGQGYGPGMMGQGYGPGMMGQGYGPGMMGQGYGPGMMMPGMMPGMMYGWGADGGRDLKLDAAAARAIVAGRIAMSGNKRLTVGEVADVDEDTLIVDIVTIKEKALVEKLAVDRASGRISRVQ